MLKINYKFIKILMQTLLIISGLLFAHQSVYAEERVALDLVMNSEEKAQVYDYISETEKTSSQMQSFLKELLLFWDQLNGYLHLLGPEATKVVDKIKKAGFKNKITKSMQVLQKFDKGLKQTKGKVGNIDQVVYFYDRYTPDKENPYRSLVVLINLFEDLEKLLPKEGKNEAFKNPPSFLIRTGIRYFKEAIKLALERIKGIQEQIRKRAGNCINYVGGDRRGDSKKRKAFMKINEADVICYTGIRPRGGEIWKDTSGNNIYMWSSGKWTKLDCSYGQVENVYRTWKIANDNENVITAERLIHWCRAKPIKTFNKAQQRGNDLFEKLAETSSCQNDILTISKKYIELETLLDSVDTKKNVFTAKYIFKQKFRNNVRMLYRVISENILFYGWVKNTKEEAMSNAKVSIHVGSISTNTNVKSDGRFEVLLNGKYEGFKDLVAKIDVVATGYLPHNDQWSLYQQCNPFTILLESKEENNETNNSEQNINEKDCVDIKNNISNISDEAEEKYRNLSTIEVQINTLLKKDLQQIGENHKKSKKLVVEIIDAVRTLEILSEKICARKQLLNNSMISDKKHEENFNWIINNKNNLKLSLERIKEKYSNIEIYTKEIGSLISNSKKVKDDLTKIKIELDDVKINNLRERLNAIDVSKCSSELYKDKKTVQQTLTRVESISSRIKSLFSKYEEDMQNIKQSYNDVRHAANLGKSYLGQARLAAVSGALCIVLSEEIMEKIFIPSVLGMNFSKALGVLRNKGFNNISLNSIGKAPFKSFENSVVSLLPATRKRVEKKTRITLTHYTGYKSKAEKLAAVRDALMAQKVCVDDTVKVWNEATKQVECLCQEPYLWNIGKTACITQKEAELEKKEAALARADCSGYKRSTAVWNKALKEVRCTCQAPLVWNKSQTACITQKEAALAAADCSAYTGSKKIWNETLKQVKCICPEPYVWNKSRTACIKQREANYRFVCYSSKSFSGGKPIYRGCIRSVRSCRSIGKYHFGKYSNDLAVHNAFKRCDRGNPRLVDNQGLSSTTTQSTKQNVTEKVTGFWKVGRVGGGTTCTINLIKEPSPYDKSRYRIMVNPWGICPISFGTWVSQGSSITFRDGNGVVTGKVNRVKKGYWEGNGMKNKERFRFYIIRGGVTPP